MSIERYSEKEVEYVVKAFKIYVKKVVKHSAIDYVRKVSSGTVREVALTDSVDRKVSLSLFDSDTFFSPKDVKGALEDIISNPELQIAIRKLSEDEKKILALSIEDYSTIEIAKKMKLSSQTIKNKKNIIRKKIKKVLGGSHENRDK
mgnify:CR=1 FL=1